MLDIASFSLGTVGTIGMPYIYAGLKCPHSEKRQSGHTGLSVSELVPLVPRVPGKQIRESFGDTRSRWLPSGLPRRLCLRFARGGGCLAGLFCTSDAGFGCHGGSSTLAADASTELSAFRALPSEIFQDLWRQFLFCHAQILHRVQGDFKITLYLIGGLR